MNRVSNAVLISLLGGTLGMSAVRASHAADSTSNTTATSSDTLQEVVITAEKRSDSAQKTAISIETVSGAAIDSEGRNDITQVLKDIPGVTVRNSAGGPQIDVRGISSGALPGNDSDPAIGLSFDGVYSDSAQAPGQTAYFDVDHVEVLRGPQGTLYGVSAEGGEINVVTNQPSQKFEASGTLEGGNYNLERASGMINVPLSDLLAVRAAFNTVNRNGYYTSGGDDDVSQSARLKLLFTPSDNLSLLLAGEFTKQGGQGNIGGRNAGVPAWGLGSSPKDPYDDVSKDGGITGTLPWYGQHVQNLRTWATLNWTNALGMLTVEPAHVFSPQSTFATNRGIACPGGGCPGGPPGALTPGEVYATDASGNPLYDVTASNGATTQSSAEVRFASLPSSTIKWVGGYFYDYLRQQTTSNTFGLTTLFYWAKSQAEFVQVTLPVTDTFRLVGGLRESSDRRSFYNTSSPLSGLGGPGFGTKTFTHTDGKAGLEWDAGPQSMEYLTFATGYRPGALNEGSSATVAGPGGTTVPNLNEFTKPEELTSFEIGSKNQFLNNTLRVNADAYYYDYKDRQYTAFFFSSGPICPNGQVANGPCLIENNANKSRYIGAELNTQWLVTSNDQIGVGVAWLNAKATASQLVYLNGGVQADINGHTMPNAPDWQINGSLQHIFNLPAGDRLTPRVDVRYTSSSYIEGFNYLNSVAVTGLSGDLYTQPAYTTIDAALNYEAPSGKWTLNAYVHNAADTIYKTDTDGQSTQVGNPRTYGVIFSAHL